MAIRWIETPAPDGWLPEHIAVDIYFYDRVPHERGRNLHGVFMRKLPPPTEPAFIPWG